MVFFLLLGHVLEMKGCTCLHLSQSGRPTAMWHETVPESELSDVGLIMSISAPTDASLAQEPPSKKTGRYPYTNQCYISFSDVELGIRKLLS